MFLCQVEDADLLGPRAFSLDVITRETCAGRQGACPRTGRVATAWGVQTTAHQADQGGGPLEISSETEQRHRGHVESSSYGAAGTRLGNFRVLRESALQKNANSMIPFR